MELPTQPGLPKIDNLDRFEHVDCMYHESTLLSAQLAMMNAIDRMPPESPRKRIAMRKYLNMAAVQVFLKGMFARLQEYYKMDANWRFAFMKLKKENMELKNELRQAKASLRAYEAEG